MISKAYEKPDFELIEFALEDVLTASGVVHTTTPNTTTTLPGTTSGGVQMGQGEDIYIDVSSYFK